MYAYVDLTRNKDNVALTTSLGADMAFGDRGCLRFKAYQNGGWNGTKFYLEKRSFKHVETGQSLIGEVNFKPYESQQEAWTDYQVDVLSPYQHGLLLSLVLETKRNDFFLAISDLSVEPNANCAEKKRVESLTSMAYLAISTTRRCANGKAYMVKKRLI
ncbi:hypothetical protein HDE_14308 [Halotydeus destructor]|nr:hypothetical protein HDE_14308 [Halotydeus destructor]